MLGRQRGQLLSDSAGLPVDAEVGERGRLIYPVPVRYRVAVRCRDDDEEAPQWAASDPREKAYSDVLALVREGLSPPNIASRLCLKRTTVLAQLAVLERRGQAIKLERVVWAAL